MLQGLCIRRHFRLRRAGHLRLYVNVKSPPSLQVRVARLGLNSWPLLVLVNGFKHPANDLYVIQSPPQQLERCCQPSSICLLNVLLYLIMRVSQLFLHRCKYVYFSWRQTDIVFLFVTSLYEGSLFTHLRSCFITLNLSFPA